MHLILMLSIFNLKPTSHRFVAAAFSSTALFSACIVLLLVCVVGLGNKQTSI